MKLHLVLKILLRIPFRDPKSSNFYLQNTPRKKGLGSLNSGVVDSDTDPLGSSESEMGMRIRI
jgi:hypothetical protein